MNTSKKSFRKFFSQRGQGMVEYALLLGFVGAIAIVVMVNGGFKASIENAFGTAGTLVAEAGETSDEATSFDYETLTAEDVAPTTNYKTLNWQEINFGVKNMYDTVMGRADTVDKAVGGEINLFGQVSAMVEGHLASTNAADGTKDWEAFLSMIESAQAEKNFTSSYKRGEETIAIQRLGNSNAVQARWSDGKEVVYYRLSPDANNVMQIETNSNKSYNQFFSPIVNSGGWQRN